MEFLLIMAIGTLVAIWAVIGTRPKRPIHFGKRSPNRQSSTDGTPPWKKDVSVSHPIGGLQYLEGVERHDKDPEHQPFPLPPPRQQKRD